ncbi:YoaK family protein [Nakamurella alba]|nr:YoaK family protein [Nakamurella alba]
MATSTRQVQLMLALTFSTGIGDAVGYLGLDRVFTGNMTGNVVILGMGLVGAEGLPVTGPLLALVGFLVGAAVGGRALKGLDAGWFPRTTILLAVVAVVIAALAGLLFVFPHPTIPVAVTVTTLLSTAMGLQAATARHIAVKDVTTVVVTSTITAIAADSPLGGGSPKGWERRLGAIVLLILGAAVGALLLRLHIGSGIALAAVVTAVVAVVGHLGHRPHRAPKPTAGQGNSTETSAA